MDSTFALHPAARGSILEDTEIHRALLGQWTVPVQSRGPQIAIDEHECAQVVSGTN